MVLGTAQFGMDYGISNLSGKPSKKEVFKILDLAWEKGVRIFDTAPGYGSEALLGEFISTNVLSENAKVLTKIPPLEGESDYEKAIMTTLESSLNNLGCPIDVLFFHNPADSRLLVKDPHFFEKLQRDNQVSNLGVSVYETQEVEHLSGCPFELAFQFPFNVLDRRFERVSMPQGKRYARSIFLQGLLATSNDLRFGTPLELLNLHKEFHDILANNLIDPAGFVVSFVVLNNTVDYFLVGVESKKQLMNVLNRESDISQDSTILEPLLSKISEKWLDPREWGING